MRVFKQTAKSNRLAFTLIEVLVVVAIIALLVAILLPSLSRARDQAKAMSCLANLKQVGNAMAYYINDNRSNFLPPFTYPIRFRYKNNTNAFFDPYWFQYLPFRYLSNQHEVVKCPSDQLARQYGRSGFPELTGGAPRITYSFAMNDRLPTPDKNKTVTYQAMYVQGLLRDSRERYSPTSLKYIKVPSATDYLLETKQHNLMSGDSKSQEFRLDHGGRRDKMNLLFADTHGELRDFTTIWYGDRATGVPSLNTAPGRFRQLWYGNAQATTQIFY